MLTKDFQLKFFKLIKNKRPFVRDILCVSRTTQYLHKCLKTKGLCVKNNTIFTQMLENKRPFVSRTIQYLHRCLKTKGLCLENNTMFTQMLENKRPFVSRTMQYLHSTKTLVVALIPYYWYNCVCHFFFEIIREIQCIIVPFKTLLR